MDTTIADIKKELRANMNGVASRYMREHGLDYHVNFGIDLPRLREIAAEFAPSAAVAQQLWGENVRESKILAAMLMPTEAMDRPLADLWMEGIANEEIASLIAMNLFVRLPFAADLAFEWMAAEPRLRRLTGLLVLARLLASGAELNPRAAEEARDQAQCALAETSDAALVRAARAVIRNLD